MFYSVVILSKNLLIYGFIMGARLISNHQCISNSTIVFLISPPPVALELISYRQVKGFATPDLKEFIIERQVLGQEHEH